MGTWDIKPWDNDAAADWYHDFFKSSDFVPKVMGALQAPAHVDRDHTRAAAALVVLLAHNYVWPIDRLDADLKLAITRLEECLEIPENQELPEMIAMIRQEIAELRSRLRPVSQTPAPPPAAARPWWKFW